MKSYILFILLIILNSISCAHHTKEEWKSRSIYQLLTDRFAKTEEQSILCPTFFNVSCGGSFKGIIEHLDYIKGMGFDAIWISPPLKNKEGSYHGYHNIDLYSINEHFGTSEELKDLINTCHEKDIWVILDAVPNHMAGDLDISTFIPFNSPDHYHSLTNADCNGHWDEQEYKEKCRIWGMPDLKQENDYVNKTLIEWLQKMLNDYDFDGVRYADVPNIPTWFWKQFTMAAEGTYTFGIFDSNDVEYIASYQNYMDGVGNYPLFYQLRSSFCDGSMIDLNTYIQNSKDKFLDPKYNTIWFDNHDNERFLYQCKLGTRQKALRNIIIFTLFYEGVPIFYYGDEQYCDKGGEADARRQTLFGNYDEDSDIYIMLQKAHQVRKKYETYDKNFMVKYVDENNFVFSRGPDVIIAVCNGKYQNIEIKNHGLSEDDKFCNKLDPLDCVSLKNDVLMIRMSGEPKIYVKTSFGHMINISGLLFVFLFFLILF